VPEGAVATAEHVYVLFAVRPDKDTGLAASLTLTVVPPSADEHETLTAVPEGVSVGSAYSTTAFILWGVVVLFTDDK
jgi:hypothetical protein